jgi:hypothetical protein
MPAPPPAFRSKSSFIGGGNGAVGERKSVDPGDCTSPEPAAWFFALVFSTPTLRFAPALGGGIRGAVSSAVVHSVSVKSRMPKLRTYLSQLIGTGLVVIRRAGTSVTPEAVPNAGHQAGVIDAQALKVVCKALN